MSLTKKQERLLANIWKFEQENRIPPSFSDIKKLMMVRSFQSVVGMLNRLELHNWITKEANKARSISLTNKTKEYLMTVGAKEVINYKFDNTNSISMKGSDTTRSEGHNDISNSYVDTPNQRETIADIKNVALKHFDSFLSSTSTTAVVHAKEFIHEFSYGPLTVVVLFLLFNKFTNLSFEQVIVVVTFCVLAGLLIKNHGKEKHVSSN